MLCPLCSLNTQFFSEYKSRSFYLCDNCQSIHVPKEFHLSENDEIKRYNLHNNDVNDKGYREFVMPVVRAVCSSFSQNSIGLDYGCGPGPVAVNMLNVAGYSLSLFDPCFVNHTEVLNEKYDYILCTEVMEHFKNPAREFHKLKSLLKPSGKLICTTDFYSPDIDFQNWYYKNDSTHIFFYSLKSLEYIKQTCEFRDLTTDNRLIIFQS